MSKETLLGALAIDLQNIARTARFFLERTENGFAEPYRMPDIPTESAITIQTDAVLQRLEDQLDDAADTKAAKAALRARFIDYELPADFVAHLRADRNAITDANRRNQTEAQGGVENTELIGQLLGQAATEVAGLDTAMHNKYTRQPEKLRAWQSASHVASNARRSGRRNPWSLSPVTRARPRKRPEQFRPGLLAAIARRRAHRQRG